MSTTPPSRIQKVGLVLSGGGGKGAYQIGVWNALHELGLDTTVAAVAGASVGGLNGVLFAQGRRELAERMWLNVESYNLLTVDKVGLAVRLARAYPGIVGNVLTSFINQRGLFEQTGLERMIAEGLDPQLLLASKPLTVSGHAVRDNRLHYLPVDQVVTAPRALLATSALPGLFSDVEINGILYTDGGFYWGLPHKSIDNTPLKPLVDAGCDLIIAVFLSQDDVIDLRAYPGCKVVPIVPGRSLGSALDALDFSNAGAARRMQQGYDDARSVLSVLELFWENTVAYEQLWQQALAGEAGFRESVARVGKAQQTAASLADDIEQFDRTIADDDFLSTLDLADDPADDDRLSPLERAASALLDDITRRELVTDVEQFIRRNQNNSSTIEAAVMDAVASLSAVPGRSDHLARQGVLGRLFGAITGRNQQFASAIQNDLAQAQFAALRLIAATQQQQLLSFEFTVAVNNRLNMAFAEVARLGESLNNGLRQTYRSMARAYLKLRERIVAHEVRLDRLERQLELHNWLHVLKVQTHGGVAYPALPLPALLVCLANDFFVKTGPRRSTADFQLLQTACVTLGLDQKSISAGQFYAALLASPDLLQRLTAQLVRVMGCADLAQSKMLDLVMRRALGQDPRLCYEGEFGLDWNLPQSCSNFLIDIVYHLSRAGFQRHIGQVLDQDKQNLLGQLDSLHKIVDEQRLSATFKGDIAALETELKAFRFRVPLIGVFSAGKSTLINAWLEAEVQAWGVNPVTAIATEFHYAEPGCEQLVAHYTDGRREECPLDQRASLEAEAAQLLYCELHLTLPVLCHYPDLVLVDMPGIDSPHVSHQQSVHRYIGDGVAFIVCVDAKLGLSESLARFLNEIDLYQLDYSVLACKKDLILPDERGAKHLQLEQAAAQLSGLGVAVGMVDAHNKDLLDFDERLAEIDRGKALRFAAQFRPRIVALAGRIDEQCRMLAQQSSPQADKLAQTKRDMKTKIAVLNRQCDDEQLAFQRNCDGNLCDTVVLDVRNALEVARPGWARDLAAGRSIEAAITGMLQNTYKLAMAARLGTELDRISTKLGRLATDGLRLDLPDLFATGLDGAATGGSNFGMGDGALIGSVLASSATATGFGSLAVGGLAMGPIGLLLGGLLGALVKWFSNRNKEAEAQEQLARILDAVTAQVRSTTPQALRTSAEPSFKAMREALDNRIAEVQAMLAGIEQTMQVHADKRAEQIDKLHAARRVAAAILEPQ